MAALSISDRATPATYSPIVGTGSALKNNKQWSLYTQLIHYVQTQNKEQIHVYPASHISMTLRVVRSPLQYLWTRDQRLNQFMIFIPPRVVSSSVDHISMLDHILYGNPFDRRALNRDDRCRLSRCLFDPAALLQQLVMVILDERHALERQTDGTSTVQWRWDTTLKCVPEGSRSGIEQAPPFLLEHSRDEIRRVDVRRSLISARDKCESVIIETEGLYSERTLTQDDLRSCL